TRCRARAVPSGGSTPFPAWSRAHSTGRPVAGFAIVAGGPRRAARRRSRRSPSLSRGTASPVLWRRDMALLEIRDLKKYFPVAAGLLGQQREYVKAIDGVSLDVEDGETVGLVGESGCGKTSLGRCGVRLFE